MVGTLINDYLTITMTKIIDPPGDDDGSGPKPGDDNPTNPGHNDIITQKADFYTYTQCSIHAGIKSLHLITA